MPPYSPFQFQLLCANYLALLVLALVVGWHRRRTLFGGHDPLDAWLVPVAAVAGFAFRALVPVRGIFHENGHGYRLLETAARPEADLHVYGSGYKAFFYLVFHLLPPTGEVVIATNIVLGAATVLFVGWLAARLVGPGAGAGAALALALLPVHIQQSATESRFIFVMAFWTFALWLAVELRREPRWDLALLCALAAAPAGQARPGLAFAPLVVFAFAVLAQPGARAFLRTRAFAVLAVSVVALTVGHYAWMARLHLARQGSRHYFTLIDLSFERFRQGLTGGPILLDQDYTPQAMVLLAGLGLLAGLVTRPRGMLLLAILFSLLTWLYAARSIGFAELVRFTVPSQVFLAALCGPALALLVRVEKRMLVRSVLAAPAFTLLLALGAGSILPTHTPTAQLREYLFLQSAYQVLPEGCALVKPDDRRPGRNVNAPFPFTELRHHVRGPGLAEGGLMETGQAAWDRLSQHRCVLYYRGLACFSFDREEPEPRELRSRCREFEESYQLTPVVTEEILTDTLAPYRFVLPSPSFTLGFFRVEGPRSDTVPAGAAGEATRRIEAALPGDRL